MTKKGSSIDVSFYTPNTIFASIFNRLHIVLATCNVGSLFPVRKLLSREGLTPSSSDKAF
jgi:hypothetical protein